MSEKQKKSLSKELIEWALYILSAVLIASFIQSQLFAFTTVNQSSMENTLFEGHMLVMEKLSYQFGNPKKGDIVVFLQDEETNGFFKRIDVFTGDIIRRFNKQHRTNRLIKRVVAIEGDIVDIRDGKLYVNDDLIEESYARGVTMGYVQEYPLVVSENHVFVLGDNREHSKDSRQFGEISINSIEGKTVFRIFPFSKMGSLKIKE